MMQTQKQIETQWLSENKKIFLPDIPNTFFINDQWVAQIISALFDTKAKVFSATLLADLIKLDRNLIYPPSKILASIDKLREIILESDQELIKGKLVYLRNGLMDQFFENNLQAIQFPVQQRQAYPDYWQNEAIESTPPDIHKILGEILWLLIQITNSDQVYLYLADFPYQSYNPFMALGKLTLNQKRAFFMESLRPDTDILLSKLILDKETIELNEKELIVKFPSYIYEKINIKQALAIPITIEERVLGFMLLNKNECQDCPPYPDSTMKIADSIAGAMALALENSRLYEITNQRLAESQSINEINLALLQSFQLEDVLNIICENAINLAQGIGSSIHLLENGNSVLRRVSYSGYLIHQQSELPLSDSFLKIALNNNEAVLINKSSIDQRLPDGSKFSVLAVPLSIHKNVVGVLDIIKKRNKFTPDDIRVIKIFADQAAIAIEHANLYQQAGLTAKLEERQKMARNLHDSVNQNLYAILLYSRTIKKLIINENYTKALDIVDQLKHTSKEALNELRIFIHELRPSILENEGLILAIQRRLESVEEKLGFTVDFSHPESLPSIPVDIQDGLYRITQEALNNVVKHAKADKINVILELSDNNLSLVIQDNGIGYSDAIKYGYGIKSMQERANLMQAELKTVSILEDGTTVKVEVKII